MVWSNGWAALPCPVVQLELKGQIELLKDNDAVNEPKKGLGKHFIANRCTSG